MLTLRWHPGIWGFLCSQLTGKSDSLYLDSLGKPYGVCWAPAFILGIWNFGMRQRLPLRTFPNRGFGCWDSSGLPWAKTLYRGCCLFKAGGGVSSAWPSWEAEIIKNFHTDRPRIHLCLSPYYPARYITTSLHLSCDHNCMLSPVSPFNKLLHLGGGLKTIQ